MPLADDLVLSKANRHDMINSDEISSAAAAYTLALTRGSLDHIPEAEEQAAAGYGDKEDGGNRGQDLDESIKLRSSSLSKVSYCCIVTSNQSTLLQAQYLLLYIENSPSFLYTIACYFSRFDRLFPLSVLILIFIRWRAEWLRVNFFRRSLN